jgi:Rieske Fe-S protein
VRGRALSLLVGFAAVLVVAAAGIALLAGDKHPSHPSMARGTVSVGIGHLRPGDVLTTTDTYQALHNRRSAPVFVVETSSHTFLALIGTSTHLGCRVEWVNAPGYRRFEQNPKVVFEDPCGGSLFALDGTCLGGPCPRDLDRLSSIVVDQNLKINLSDRILGPPRDPNAQL